MLNNKIFITSSTCIELELYQVFCKVRVSVRLITWSFFKKKNKKRMELFGEVRWEVKDGALNVGIGQVRWKLTFFCFAFFLLKL